MNVLFVRSIFGLALVLAQSYMLLTEAPISFELFLGLVLLLLALNWRVHLALLYVALISGCEKFNFFIINKIEYFIGNY